MKAIKSNLSDGKKILHCPDCGGEYSGDAGDYFYLPDDHIFFCSDCGTEMELVEKITTITYK